MFVALLAGACPSFAQSTDFPRDVAVRVADRLVAETRFDFKPILQRGKQEGFYVVDFFDTFGSSEEGLYYAGTLLEIDSTVSDNDLSDLALGISHSTGALQIRIDDEPVFFDATARDGSLRNLDYDLIRPDTTVPLQLGRGSHRVRIKFEPTGDSAVLDLGLVHAGSEISFEHAELSAPGLANAPESIRFLVIGPFDAGEHGIETEAGPDREWLNLTVDYDGLNGKPVRWDIPRVHLIRDHPEHLDYSDWRYFSGTFLDALYSVSDTFDNLDCTVYINRHLDFFLDHRDVIAAERKDYHLIQSAFGHYFRASLLDDMGMQAVPFADRLLRARSVPGASADGRDLELVKHIADYVYARARRLQDGTFARLNPDSLTVWADDMFVGSIILIRAARLLRRPEYRAEAVRQVLLIHQHLSDPESGLYWHGWFARTDRHSSSKWGRANGWTMMAKTELLLNLDPKNPDYQKVLKLFQNHAAALLKVQSPGGRWHQVLDNPDTYLETSATAMFVRAFAEGIRNGWLPRNEYLEATQRGWKAVAGQVRDDGMVEGIVRGTPIFYSDDEYENQPTRLNDPRGLGAVLYAAASMEKLDRWLNDDK
jgi:rhamnogalacturonyl hydrolase YesR